jgi:hypothetical protein
MIYEGGPPSPSSIYQIGQFSQPFLREACIPSDLVRRIRFFQNQIREVAEALGNVRYIPQVFACEVKAI